MEDFQDRAWDLADRIDEAIQEALFDEERLINAVKAFGAGLLGREAHLSAVEQRILFVLGQWLMRQIKRAMADRAALAEQRRRMKVVGQHRTLQQLLKMDPADFEYWTANYFKNRGFRNVLVTPFSADFGIDIYMTCPDRKKAVVQCKRYKGVVGRPIVQQTYGAMHLVNAKRCYVVTTGRFAETARKLEAEHSDIILLDGEQLTASSSARCNPRSIRRRSKSISTRKSASKSKRPNKWLYKLFTLVGSRLALGCHGR